MTASLEELDALQLDLLTTHPEAAHELAILAEAYPHYSLRRMDRGTWSRTYIYNKWTGDVIDVNEATVENVIEHWDEMDPQIQHNQSIPLNRLELLAMLQSSPPPYNNVHDAIRHLTIVRHIQRYEDQHGETGLALATDATSRSIQAKLVQNERTLAEITLWNTRDDAWDIEIKRRDPFTSLPDDSPWDGAGHDHVKLHQNLSADQIVPAIVDAMAQICIAYPTPHQAYLQYLLESYDDVDAVAGAIGEPEHSHENYQQCIVSQRVLPRGQDRGMYNNQLPFRLHSPGTYPSTSATIPGIEAKSMPFMALLDRYTASGLLPGTVEPGEAVLIGMVRGGRLTMEVIVQK